MMRCAVLLLLCCLHALPGAEEQFLSDLPYRAQGDGADDPRCRLDLLLPGGGSPFTTVIWFHGGGLTGGTRSIPQGLRGQGFAVVAAGYRLSPQVPGRTCIADAAAAVAWVMQHIADYGGDPQRIVVSGHSAGGYLTLMIGLDRSWLAAEGLDANRLAALVPLSAQCITHFTIRKESGIARTQPLIDAFAPLFHVRADAPPIHLITGDRERELLGLYEENAYLWRMLRVVGHQRCTLREIPCTDHGGMVAPGLALLVDSLSAMASMP